MLKLIICGLLILASLSIPMKLHRHDLSTGARCLDGSPAAIYFAEGQQNEKTVIFFEGGGYCEGLALSTAIQSCYKRSKTQLGSSKNFPATLESDYIALLSSDQDINPLYSDWNKVFIPYCDGTLHQGSALEPISYKGTKLYFRGSNNTIAAFQFINKTFDLYGSESAVLTGTSAGGMAVYFWGNYLHDRLVQKNNLLLIPDSGIFLKNLFLTPPTQQQLNLRSSSPQPINAQVQGIFAISNKQTQMPLEQCVKLHPQQTPCFDTSNLDEYIIPPLYIIQSLYDEYVLKYILGIKCVSSGIPASLASCTLEEMRLIQKLRQKTVEVLQRYASNVKNGVWGIACVAHTFTNSNQLVNSKNWIAPINNPSLKSKTILQGLAGFVLRAGSRQLIDSVQYPLNKGCNGIKYPHETE